jgi:hypothetical protein
MTEEYIQIGNKILEYLLNKNGTCNSYEIDSSLIQPHKSSNAQDVFFAESQLKNLGLIGSFGKNEDFRQLLPEGFKAAKTGIKAYLNEQERRENIRIEKEEKDLQSVKYFLKTKWWPYIISGASLIASILLPLLLSR